MSGHSKWATIKHKKGAADARRAKVFAKLARQLEVAARDGGGDPATNATLRTMVLKAKAAQMNNDLIDRAIKRGTGQSDGGNYEAITYEGYAPGGVALLIDVLTDNRNRSSADVRNVFSKLGGSLAEPGAVGWQFSRKGVILVTTPAGQGLTTLAYALIGRHDAYTSNVKTLEREVQFRVEGVDHKKFEPEAGVEDFGAMLTKIIRRDPDVVLCGDISEPGSAKAAALMGMESPLVYVLVPADSMATAIAMWMQSVGDPKMATRCLSGVVHQRVMRTLCPNCKSPFTPAPEQAKKLGIAAGKEVQLFRPSGKVQVKNRIEDCPVCQGTSYFGQTGVFEVMSLDDEGRRLLSENDFRTAYARAVREQKMMQLQEAALLKVRTGDTSLEEVQRIFAPKQAAGAPKPASAPKA